MENDQIAVGKRPRNPLHRRIVKDLRRDWKRYLMIFVIMLVTIGFVSGMFVANNSMEQTLDSCAEKFRREDGHFILSDQADAALLTAIETGEMADVAEVFRERAYSEAEEEIRKAAEEKLEETVADSVRETITAQTEAAVQEQLTAAGAELPESVVQQQIDDAVEEALSAHYDAAYEEALQAALESDEYAESVEEALAEAKTEIDETIEEEYSKLAERYDLDDPDFEAVPVKVYELFCKEADETLEADSDYQGGIRIFQERSEVNLYDIMEGRAPEQDDEIIIDRMHADNAGIKVGDTLYAGKTAFEVVGLAAFSDYSTLYESNTDTMFDALTFDVAMTTDSGFQRLKGITRYEYAFCYENAPADENAEKTASDRFLKALITQAAASENEITIEDYVPAYANQAIIFAPNDIGSDKAMGGVLLYILIAVMAFIFAVSISTTLESEASVIGTLRASGYTKGELLRYYMSAPIIVVVLAAIFGNILGYTVFKNIVVAMYYNSYSLPTYTTIWTPDAFVRTTIIPFILMILINLAVISKTLKLSPLRFLRHDLKKNRRKKAVRLPHFAFFHRFRIRVFLQNIPNYVMLFIGITFVMILLSMAVGMPSTLSYYQESITDMMFAQDQVILRSTEDEDGEIIETAAKDAERFSVTSLERRSETFDEEVSVYGISADSRYVSLDADYYSTHGQNDPVEVYISEAYADKYSVAVGDEITLSEKYENRDYTWKVSGIYPYSAGIAVFMTNPQFNAVFERDAESFSGYMANDPIEDIDSDDIAKEITAEDMTKLAKQLDHSMGAYMLYFQYVCMIVAAIILYLLTKIIVEKNERAISMVKILGYNQREIASLYLVTTGVVVFLTEFIAMYLGYIAMEIVWRSIMMELGGWFGFWMTADGFIKEFLLVFLAYLAITLIDFNRIKHIPKVLALKNVE